MREREKIIKILEDYFRNKENVIMAFLFGSLSKGIQGAISDIDIAIYFKEEKEEIKIWCDLEKLLNREIDLIVLNRAFPIVAWEAIRGIPITIKDREKYFDYLLSISREAEDLIDFNLDAFRMKEELKNVTG